MSTNADLGDQRHPSPVAHQRETILYGQLAETIGYGGVWANMGNLLDPIKDYCQAHDLPAPTSLVVAKETVRPARAFVEGVDAEREKIYAHRWHTMLRPTFSS